MKIKFNISNSAQKKQLVSAVSGITSAMPRYMGTPTMAYQIGDCLVEKDGTLVIPDTLDTEGITLALKIHGFEGEIEGQAVAEIEEAIVEEPIMREEDESTVESIEEEETRTEEEVQADTTAVEEAAEAESTAEDTTVVEEPAEAEHTAEDATVVATAEAPADTTVVVEVTEESTAEPIGISISFPLGKHTSRSIKNLVKLLYSRGTLVSKAVQGEFLVPKEIVDELGEKDLTTAKDQVERIKQIEAEKGISIKGITFDDEKVTFDGFPETENVDLLATFQHLAENMNRQAIKQKNIQAKSVDEENEKYAFRTWLVRIGMGGSEYKKTRSLLMEHLSGHTAFKTPADAERWKARQAELKAKRKAEEENAECLE